MGFDLFGTIASVGSGIAKTLLPIPMTLLGISPPRQQEAIQQTAPLAGQLFTAGVIAGGVVAGGAAAVVAAPAIAAAVGSAGGLSTVAAPALAFAAPHVQGLLNQPLDSQEPVLSAIPQDISMDSLDFGDN